MKMVCFSAAAAAMMLCPVLLCSCGTGAENKKAEPAVPSQEIKTEPKAAEVKTEPKAEVKKAEPKAAEVKTEPKAEVKKAEPKAAEVKTEPKAEVKKAEPAPVPAAAPAPEPVPAPAAEKKKADNSIQPPIEHLVRTGDSLWAISKKYYGSGSQWKRIYEANKSAIKKQDFLEPGTVLMIPAAK